MATGGIFSAYDAWNGGFYELAIVLGPGDDELLEKAIVSLWAFPDIDGCYRYPIPDPPYQPRVAPGKALGLEARLHGVASIRDTAPIACGTYVVRFDDFDCLGFFLPMGSLQRVFPVGAYPFEDGDDLSWRMTVDDWLCRMAEHVFGFAPFRYALVAHEPSFDHCVDPTVSAVPVERWEGYLVPENGSLQWYPPNRGAPFSFPAS